MTSLRSMTLRIDALGGAVASLGLVAALWFGLLKSDSAAQELEQIKDQRIDMQTEHSKLQKMMQSIVAEQAALRATATREGHLDDPLPVQDRLRAVRERFDQHRWLDVQIMPQQWRSAVDVTEQSFTVTARAGYFEILSFFRAFETGSDWADISHLTIRPITSSNAASIGQYQLEMTLNFYSNLRSGARAQGVPLEARQGAST